MLAESGVETQARWARRRPSRGTSRRSARSRCAPGRRVCLRGSRAPRDRPAPGDHLRRVLGEWVVEIDSSANLVVVRTPPGFCARSRLRAGPRRTRRRSWVRSRVTTRSWSSPRSGSAAPHWRGASLPRRSLTSDKSVLSDKSVHSDSPYFRQVRVPKVRFRQVQCFREVRVLRKSVSYESPCLRKGSPQWQREWCWPTARAWTPRWPSAG